MVELIEIEKYFKARIQEIKTLAVRGDVWFFYDECGEMVIARLLSGYSFCSNNLI
jgi:hypothetical protein